MSTNRLTRIRTDRLSILELAALILAVLFWAMPAPAQDLTPAAVAAWVVPGEAEMGQCLTYAVCLNTLLTERGIESRIVACDWKTADLGHAMVLFRIGAQWWLLDNEQDRPIKVQGKTDLKRVRCYQPTATSVRTGLTIDVQLFAAALERLEAARKINNY